MISDANKRILEQYDRLRPRYEALCQRLHTLLESILREKELDLQSLQSRVMTRESVLAKLIRFPSPCRALDDIKDIVGIRIVAYYRSDVREILRVIQEEFSVADLVTPTASPDDGPSESTAGYHMVIQLSPARSSLPEYRLLAGMQAEIQVRSVVQHAIAEIAHKLAYARDTTTERMWSRFLGLAEFLEETVSDLHNDIVARNLAVPEVLEDIEAKAPPTERGKRLTKERAESLLKDFRDRLSKAKKEKELQSYLASHPELLYPDFIVCHPKFSLGEDYVTDYVLLVQGYQGPEYVFVEIERPGKQIFTKAGQFAEAFTQAKNQLLDWENWLTKNHAYVSRKLPQLYKPQFHLVMGRKRNLTREQKEKIHSEFFGTVRRFSTYDDIGNRFKIIIERLYGA